ncbi:MAG: FtsQ-type POTRA domain-containing protein [Actinobacteria bacterium]|nr:FtsQ-type POTRA domain-containing protein [Actinomycetota bacterium]
MTTTSSRRPGHDIDPRIRHRRQEVRRHEGRRRLRRLAVVGGVAGFVAAGALLTSSPLLDVDRVEVEGVVHTDAEEVRRAAAIDIGEAMLTVRGSRATRAIEKLPWVATATVVRSWPATVIVNVAERSAVAVADLGAHRQVILGADGRQLAVVSRGDQRAEGLPVLQGLQFEPAPGQAVDPSDMGALELAERLGAQFDAAEVRVVVTDGAVEAALSRKPGGELVARFGTPDRLEAKVSALASVVQQAGAGVAVVDVSAPDAPALTRAGP